MNIMTLDGRIEKDLKELYHNGDINTLIDDFKKCDLSKDLCKLKEDFQNCKISAAEDLSIRLFGTPTAFSIHGLPGYFTGNREAKTVMVMLNPGSDVATNDNPSIMKKLLDKLHINTTSDVNFIETYKAGNKAFGTYDREVRASTKKTKKVYPDNFDLKQAAFLKEWPKDCGVDIPDSFPPNGNKLENMDYDEALRTAENVLTQKLQLELVPYASRKFDGISKEKYTHLFPYVKILFDEIFSENYKEKEPRYVIFCSAFFEKLFEEYNKADSKDYPERIYFIKTVEQRRPEILKNRVSCSLIKICRDGKKNDKQDGSYIEAIIAKTFPNQALPNAYNRMVKYGKFCYDTYKGSNM